MTRRDLGKIALFQAAVANAQTAKPATKYKGASTASNRRSTRTTSTRSITPTPSTIRAAAHDVSGQDPPPGRAVAGPPAPQDRRAGRRLSRRSACRSTRRRSKSATSRRTAARSSSSRAAPAFGARLSADPEIRQGAARRPSSASPATAAASTTSSASTTRARTAPLTTATSSISPFRRPSTAWPPSPSNRWPSAAAATTKPKPRDSARPPASRPPAPRCCSARP